MHAFIAGLILGLVAGSGGTALIFRNNTAKALAAANLLNSKVQAAGDSVKKNIS
jgi:hypothetical protein